MPDAQTSFTQDIPGRISADVDKAKAVDAIFLFNITGDGGGVWTVNLKDNPGVTDGDAGNAECTLEMSAENWQTISDTPSQAMMLFGSGQLKVTGDVMKAMKLQEILS